MTAYDKDVRVFISNKKTLIWLILLIISVIAFSVSLIAIILMLKTPSEIKKIQQVASIPNVTQNGDDETKIPINFNELQKVNSDIYAWINISGTDINYPLLRSETEDYYLTHNVEKKKSSYGALYTQSYNTADFEDFNTVIYGHNMRNGTMFGSLKKYRDQSYFNEHQYINIYMPNRILKYRIFAAYVFDDRHLLLNYDFSDSLQKTEYINTVLSGSYGGNLRKNIAITENDRIITLSTCTSEEKERYLVQALLISNDNFGTADS